jgi:Mg-chelatase subunit ChlD
MRSTPLALVLASSLLLVAANEPEAPPAITLTLDAVDVVRKPAELPGLGFLSGKALAYQGDLELFDVVFVIDTSGSTADSSGLGEHGTWISHLPGVKVSRSDSILGAEVAAVESMLDRFDARSTRVGLVSFAGSENPYEHHAWTDAPLTSNYPAIRNALADRMLVDPEGGTDLAAGLLRGAIELLGTPSADSKPRAHSVRHLVVLTDGLPTLPEADPIGEARRAARKLAKHGIRVHIFAIGSAATDEGMDIAPVAEITHGDYHAVEDLKKLAPLLKQIEFRSLRELRVKNKTTGAPAVELTRDDAGAWSALVPFVEGANEIEVVAIAADGREQRVERRLVFGKVVLDAEQKERRDRLLVLHAETEARAAKAHSKALTVEPAPAKAP